MIPPPSRSLAAAPIWRTSWRRPFTLLALVLACCFARPVRAQIDGHALPDPANLFGPQPGVGLGAGFFNLGGDTYVNVLATADFAWDETRLGIGLPLNFLVRSDDALGTRAQKTYGGALRRRDWDEPQDALRLLRYLSYGHKRAPIYARVGQLWTATLGHGTLVNRYSNALQIDHPRFGAEFDANATYGGGETVLDSVVRPGLVGGRGYVRPFGETWMARGWAVGATLAADPSAPRTLVTAAGPSGTQILVQDAAGNPQVAETSATVGAGIDTEYEIVSNQNAVVIPYLDFNRIFGAGNGLHVGALGTFLIPFPAFDLALQSRLEFRVLQAGYIPEYFDQSYDLGRLQYALPGERQYAPKRAVAATARDQRGSLRRGYYGELAATFGNAVQVGGLLQDYEGGSASFGLFAAVPGLQILKVRAHYLRSNFGSLTGPFRLDERSLLWASAAYKVVGPFYLRVDYTRRWILNPGDEQVHGVGSFTFGAAVYLTL